MSADHASQPGADLGFDPDALRRRVDADFAVLEGHPFDYRVVPQYVFVDGKMEAEPR